MPKYLFVNAINPDLPSFAVLEEEAEPVVSVFIGKQEELNRALSAFFKKNKLSAKSFKAVLAISGPGSFSGCRAGVVLANVFNFLHKIPVLGIKNENSALLRIFEKYLPQLKNIKSGSRAEVYYDKEPDITMPKK